MKTRNRNPLTSNDSILASKEHKSKSNEPPIIQPRPERTAGLDNIRLNLRNAISLTATDPDCKQTFTAMIHWVRLQAVVSKRIFDEVFHDFFKDENYEVNEEANIKFYKGDPGYKCKATGTQKQYMCWNEEGGKYTVALCMTGEWLEHKGTKETMRWLWWLDVEGFVPTRLDPSVDDHQKTLDTNALMEALNDKNYTGFRDRKVIFSGKGEGWDGMTYNLGSRESESYTRIYETKVKHGFHAYRTECELKGEKAKAGLKYLLEHYGKIREPWILRKDDEKEQARCESWMAGAIARLAVGQVDFVDKRETYANGSLEKAERLPFWQDFLSKVGEGVKIKIKAKKRTLRKRGDWLLRGVSKSLAIVAHGLGEEGWQDCLYHLVRLGSEKMDNEADMWVAELREEGLEGLFGTIAYG